MLQQIAILILIVLLSWREYSWSSYDKNQHNEIKVLKDRLSALILQLQLDLSLRETSEKFFSELNYSYCGNSTGNNGYNAASNLTSNSSICEDEESDAVLLLRKLKKEFNMSTGDSSNTGNQVLAPARRLFDRVGLIMLCGCCLLKYYELHLIHQEVHSSTKYTDRHSANHALLQYISAWFPVSSFILFTIILLWGSMAWIGVVSRNYFTGCSLKLILLWWISTPVFNTLLNGYNLRKYMPRDGELWKKSLVDIKWWVWVVTRLVGMTQIDQLASVLIKSMSIIAILWPYRYFYFYDYQCRNQDNTDSFITNMIMHHALLMSCHGALIIYLLGSPTILSRNNRFILLCPIIWPGTAPHWILMQVCSLLLCVLRVLYASLFLTSSWWGSAVLLLFPVGFVYVGISNLAVYSTYIYRENLSKKTKNDFCIAFYQKYKKSYILNGEGKMSKIEEDQIKSLSLSLYESLVDRTCREYTLDGGPITYYTIDDRIKAKKAADESELKSNSNTHETKNNENESENTNLEDLQLAYEYTLAEFGKLSEHFDSALTDVLLAKKKKVTEVSSDQRDTRDPKLDSAYSGDSSLNIDANPNKSGDTGVRDITVTADVLREVFEQLLGSGIR